MDSEMGDLRETAALAHLNLGDEELRAAFPAFTRMLGYFAAMRAAMPAASPAAGGADGALAAGRNAATRVVGADWFRADGGAGEPGAGEAGGGAGVGGEKFLDNAGERDGRFIVIPNVL